MELGEYGLTRGTCFVARRLEVVAVAGLLWISWCVLGAGGFRVFFFFFFLRTLTACCKCEAALFTFLLLVVYSADYHSADRVIGPSGIGAG